MKTPIFPDENYSASVKEVILPYLDSVRKGPEGFFERAPGERIRYERFRTDQQPAKGEVVVFHGYTEGITKFYECLYYFLKEGYDVSMMEHRGHGRSYKLTQDRFKVVLPSERDMMDDMHYFVTEIVLKDVVPGVQGGKGSSGASAGHAGKPLFLYGHSMGGGLGARFIEEWPDIFDRAILTSPMLELNGGHVPKRLTALVASRVIAHGRGEGLIPGAVPFNPDDPDGDFANSCATSRDRYAWYQQYQLDNPDYQTSATTWITALTFYSITKDATTPIKCAAVKHPVLVFQADSDNMVEDGGQQRFIQRIPEGLGTLVRIPGSKHEIFRSTTDVLEKYWPIVFDFLEGKEIPKELVKEVPRPRAFRRAAR